LCLPRTATRADPRRPRKTTPPADSTAHERFLRATAMRRDDTGRPLARCNIHALSRSSARMGPANRIVASVNNALKFALDSASR